MEAKSVLIESAKINKNTFLLNDIDLQLKSASQEAIEKVTDGWWTIWQEKTAIRNLLRVHLAWSIFIVVYYGMLLNIRAFGRDHLTMNTIIAGSYWFLSLIKPQQILFKAFDRTHISKMLQKMVAC